MTSKSLSEPQLRVAFRSVMAVLLAAAAAFYFLQNAGHLPGGQISPIKLAWLGCAILFWFLLPALLLLDSRMPPAARRACAVLLAGLILRGLIELYMMYVTGNWHPWMGISHNVFMLALMSALIIPLRKNPDRLYSGYLLVATAMFIPESGFAWYMLTYATEPGATVYFVAGFSAHAGVLIITAICVLALLGYLIFFYRKWLNGQTRRQLL